MRHVLLVEYTLQTGADNAKSYDLHTKGSVKVSIEMGDDDRPEVQYKALAALDGLFASTAYRFPEEQRVADIIDSTPDVPVPDRDDLPDLSSAYELRTTTESRFDGMPGNRITGGEGLPIHVPDGDPPIPATPPADPEGIAGETPLGQQQDGDAFEDLPF